MTNDRNRVELKLIPTPGTPAEFLATLQPTDSGGTSGSAGATGRTSLTPLYGVIVLEGYTREAWADDASHWNRIPMESVDGRNKLPGFVKYLRDRQKSAFGRYLQRNNGMDETFVFVVSHKQASSQVLKCRYAALSNIPKCPLSHKSPRKSNNEIPKKKAIPPPSSSEPRKRKAGGAGLLGNLVGAQKRTNQAVHAARAMEEPPARSATAATTEGSGPAASAFASDTFKTAGEVLADFRQEMEQKMLDFDISSDPVLKVSVDLASHLKKVDPAERENGKVTMEILKYIVYEQAEEVNEEWVAYREPSEFMDDVTIAIYKEGEAPPEVLEDLQKAEMPDEARAQQIVAQQQRQQQEQKALRDAEAAQKERLRQADDEDDFAALNQNKRDRRTIEDFQRRNN